MKITLEKTETGLYRVTGDDVRLHIVGKTPSDALRHAADFIEEVIMAQPIDTAT